MGQTKSYVATDEDGVMRVGKNRVLLESVVAAFEQGDSPESIRSQYPALTLEEVYGALTFCLSQPDMIQAYMKKQDQVWNAARAEYEQQLPPVVERLRALRNAPAET